MRQSYHTPGGGMTSPAVAYRRGASKSPAGETMSPPVVRGGVLPADWPKSTGSGGHQATPSGFMASPSPVAPPTVSGRQDPERETISMSHYTQLQAERATVEVKLNTAENKLKDAESREQCLVNQLQRERAQHTQVCSYLLNACKSLTAKADLPDSVASPGRASTFADTLQQELKQAETDRELATAAAEAATAKIDQLTAALQNRDTYIASKEAALEQAHTRIETLESEVHLLLDQLRLAQTSPVRHPETAIDDSLITWANTNETAVPTRTQHTPSYARSPARDIQTPSTHGNVNHSHTSTNPQSQETTGEWPPSPRRQLNTSSAMDSTLNDTLPDEFTASPGREPTQEMGQPMGQDWKVHGEEWPPSPRRNVQEQEQAPVNQQDLSNVTATPDQEERNEWPPSPQRHRGDEYRQEQPQQQQQQREGEEWPPSPQRTRFAPQEEYVQEEGQYAQQEQRYTKEYAAEERRQEAVPTPGEEWPPSPQRRRRPSPTENQEPQYGREEYVSEERCKQAPPARGGDSEWPPSPHRRRGAPPTETEEPQYRRESEEHRGQAPPTGGEDSEWPPSPRRRGAPPTENEEPQYRRESEEHRRQAPPASGEDSEWPPSPQRRRGAPPTENEEPQYRRESEEHRRQAPPAKKDDEWPPSPRRCSRGPEQAEEEDKEWPPSPRRQRTSTNQEPEQRQQQQQQPARKKEVGHWPQSPRRTPPPGAQSELKTPDSLEKHDPQYAESINVESPPPSPTPGTEPGLDQTTTPVDAGNNISQKLEYPATSPKNQKRDELNDSVGNMGGRRRSVGFVDVPSEPRRHSEGSDLGAVRRSVDSIRDPSDLTPTAAKLRIEKLEKELRRIKGEPEHCSLDADMKRRAQKAFNAVDAMHQKDGSISKTELGKVLKEDPLGAKILFHELDGDDSGEIDVNEWLGWFNRLKSKDAAENMLEWIEERLEIVAKERGVHFSRATIMLPEDTEHRAKKIFEKILDRVNNEHFIYKPALISILRDESHVLKQLPTNDEQNVYVTQWLSWLEEIESSPHASAASTLTWVESKLAPEAEVIATTEYNGLLSEEQRSRAVASYHRLDEIAQNSGVITIESLCGVLQLDLAASKFMLKELIAITAEDITMEDWINWFDVLERGNGSATDMLQLIESKLR